MDIYTSAGRALKGLSRRQLEAALRYLWLDGKTIFSSHARLTTPSLFTLGRQEEPTRTTNSAVSYRSSPELQRAEAKIVTISIHHLDCCLLR